MQKIHVRNIFKLFIPIRATETSNISFSPDGAATFGFTVNQVTEDLQYSYKVRLYANTKHRQGQKKLRDETEFTSRLQWAKKTAISFKKSPEDDSIEFLVLHLRIGPGLDFRKVPKRFVRFEVECCLSGQQQFAGTSQLCQLLGKRRRAGSSDVDDVSIRIFWRGMDVQAVQNRIGLEDAHYVESFDHMHNSHSDYSELSLDRNCLRSSSESNDLHSHSLSSDDILMSKDSGNILMQTEYFTNQLQDPSYSNMTLSLSKSTQSIDMRPKFLGFFLEKRSFHKDPGFTLMELDVIKNSWSSKYIRNGGIFVAPYSGLYRFTISLRIRACTTPTDYSIALELRLNGTTSPDNFGGVQMSSLDSPMPSYVEIRALNPGDSIQLYIYSHPTLGTLDFGRLQWIGEYLGEVEVVD